MSEFQALVGELIVRTYDTCKKKSAKRSVNQSAPIQTSQVVESQSSTIQAKSNEEGLAEWAVQREKWARLGTPWMDKVPNFAEVKPWIQPKLAIGRPEDKHEQEADQISKRVVHHLHSPSAQMEMPQSNSQAQPSADPQKTRGKPMLDGKATSRTEISHLRTSKVNQHSPAQVSESLTEFWGSYRPPQFKSPLILRQPDCLKDLEKRSSTQQSNLQQPQDSRLQNQPNVVHLPVHLATQSVMNNAKIRRQGQDISALSTLEFPSRNKITPISKAKTPTILRQWESSPEDPTEKQKWEYEKKTAILQTIDLKLPQRPKELQEYDDIYANIGVFLEDKGRFLERLKDLEKSLKEKASKEESKLQYSDLVDQLTQFEKSIGLNVDPVRVKVQDVFGPAVIFGTICADYFLDTLVGKGITWEDPGFYSHGALSHRIQWYAIAKEVLNNPNPYGGKFPKDLYVTVPKYGRYQETHPNDPTIKSPDRSLWDILVDTVPTEERAKEDGLIFSDTGRSPDTINKYFNSELNNNQESKEFFPNLGKAISLYGKEAITDIFNKIQDKQFFQDVINQKEQQYAYWNKSEDQKK